MNFRYLNRVRQATRLVRRLEAFCASGLRAAMVTAMIAAPLFLQVDVRRS